MKKIVLLAIMCLAAVAMYAVDFKYIKYIVNGRVIYYYPSDATLTCIEDKESQMITFRVLIKYSPYPCLLFEMDTDYYKPVLESYWDPGALFTFKEGKEIKACYKGGGSYDPKRKSFYFGSHDDTIDCEIQMK